MPADYFHLSSSHYECDENVFICLLTTFYGQRSKENVCYLTEINFKWIKDLHIFKINKSSIV